MSVDKLGKQTTPANLWHFIGDSKLIRLWYKFAGGAEQSVLVKCEQFNLTGSIKDRMALYILQKARDSGELKPGDLIVEATSGNTGISLAAIGRALGHRVQIIMPDWMSKERVALIKGYGAEIRLVSAEEGGFKGAVKMAEMMAHLDQVFLPRQFENRFNVEAHEKTTGREIGHQLLLHRVRPDAFVAGVGTGGTVMGVGKYLKTLYPYMKVHPLEPAESPTLTTGFKIGSHRIQGISDEFIPAIVDLAVLDKVVQVESGDAILMAQSLSGIGLGVGISSGANLLGAIGLQQRMGKDAVVVTVFPDSNKKYLSTDLFAKEPVKPGYISRLVELLRFEAMDQ